MKKIKWYWNRLRRMSLEEIVYRVAQYAMKHVDRSRRFGWHRFGQFGGKVVYLKSLEELRSPTCYNADLEVDEALSQGHYSSLGMTWRLQNGWEKAIWHLDPWTGKTWPGKGTFTFDVPYRHADAFGDVKFTWEINRLQFLQSMAAASKAHNDCGGFRRIGAILTGWMSANPPFDGLNWCSGIEIATRIVSLLYVLSLAPCEVRPELIGLARRFVGAHAFWLRRYPSLYSSANNHRVAELVGLFLAAAAFPDMPHATDYSIYSRKGLEQEISRQFHEDGVGAEQSPTYASYSLEWFLICARVASDLGVPFSQEYLSRLLAASSHLKWILDDGGQAPKIGDDDEGYVLAYNGSEQNRYVQAVADSVMAWLCDHTPTRSGLAIFKNGGYTVFREVLSVGTLLAIFDHGPLGFLSIAAHGHADALSLWMHIGDEPVLVDAGTYLYHSGASKRDLLRGTSVHNTVCIEGVDQSVISGAFNWSKHAKTSLIAQSDREIVAECLGYEDRFGVRHRRHIVFDSNNKLQIRDALIGQPRRNLVHWSSGFNLAPGISYERHSSEVLLTTPKGRSVLIRLDGDQASWDEIEMPYSPHFNKLESMIRLVTNGLYDGSKSELTAVSIEVLC